MAIYRVKEGRSPGRDLLVPEVEATQWQKNGDHPLDYEGEAPGLVTAFDPATGQSRQKLLLLARAEGKAKDWEGAVVRRFRLPGSGGLPCPTCGVVMHDHGWLDIGGPGITVCPGAYVVTVPFDSGRPDRPRYTAIDAETFETLYALVAG